MAQTSTEIALRYVGTGKDKKKVIRGKFRARCGMCGSTTLGCEIIWNDTRGGYVHTACDPVAKAWDAGSRTPERDEWDEPPVPGRPPVPEPARGPVLDAELEARIAALVKAAVPPAAKAEVAAMTNKIGADLTALTANRIADAVTVIEREYGDKVRAAVKALEDAARTGEVKTVIEIRSPGKTVTFGGDGEVVHERFPWLLKLAQARKAIFLPGPTGCGKSHIGAQIARALALPFGVLSCSPGMTEGQLLGRSIPNITTGAEVYRESEFVRIYEGGGVFMFDEIDAGDATVLLVLNSALANGYLNLPGRPEKPIAKMHKDFVCIAAANTWGSGADRQYVGRNQLDLATLDRFRMGTVPIGYSPTIEARLCPHGALRTLCLDWRQKITDNRLLRVLSTRFMRDAHDMLTHGGADFEDVRAAFFAGWPENERQKVDCVPLPSNSKAAATAYALPPTRKAPMAAPARTVDDDGDEVPF